MNELVALKQLQHAQILLKQGRFGDAETSIKEALQLQPDLRLGRYLLMFTLLQQRKLAEAEKLLTGLLEEDPSEPDYLRALAYIRMEQERFGDAEKAVRSALHHDAEDVDSYATLAAILYNTKKHKEAIAAAQAGLSIDPDHVECLNMLSMAQAATGDGAAGVESAIAAINKEPENPHAHSTLGYQKLRLGKHEEALEHFREALRLDPQFAYAQHGLLEAMKSKYWIYRLFLTTQMKMATKNANTQWVIIIGGYILYRVLLSLAKNNPSLAPFIWPLVALIGLTFLMTWIIGPLFNLYMLTNQYGRLILDKFEKNAARLSGISLALGLIALLGFAFTQKLQFLFSGLAFIIMMVPISRLGNDPEEKKRAKNVQLFAKGLIGLGVVGALVAASTGALGIVTLFFVGIFVFSWVANAAVIR